MAESEVDLSKTYDAIVVGSGAAGGMAAHVLTTKGLQVLLLEAGKKLPIEKELRSMEWPYDNPHRGGLSPDSHALTLNEYTVRNPPYNTGFEKYKNLYNYVGNTDYVKNIVVNERDHPTTGTNYAWVRARCLGGKTNIWGRLALRLLVLRLAGVCAAGAMVAGCFQPLYGDASFTASGTSPSAWTSWACRIHFMASASRVSLIR